MNVSLLKVEYSDTKGHQITCSVLFEKDLTYKLFFNGVPVENKVVSNVTKRAQVQTVTEAKNIASQLAGKEKLEPCEIYKNILQQLIDFFDSTVEEDLEPDNASKLSFIIEQLSLLFVDPKGRRYLPGLLSMSLLWENISPCLYREILAASVLTMPSTSHLKRLSQAVTVGTGLPLSTIKYLTTRFQTLNSHEGNVTLMLDEIYSAQRVEYCRGKFLGCENNEVTKTVLTFMVKSAAGNYQDVVCLVPVNKIS